MFAAIFKFILMFSNQRVSSAPLIFFHSHIMANAHNGIQIRFSACLLHFSFFFTLTLRHLLSHIIVLVLIYFCGAQHGRHSFKITTLEAFFRAADIVIDRPKAEEEGEHELVWMIIMIMMMMIVVVR